MADSFFDTCALQHKYLETTYSYRVRQILGKRGVTALIADKTMLEMPSAFARQCRSKNWGKSRFDRLHRHFAKDVADGILKVRTIGLREHHRAIHLIRFAGVIQRRNLGSADALIAACALEYALEKQTVVNLYTSDWTLYSCLRDINAFRSTMNLALLGSPKDGSAAFCQVQARTRS